MKSTHALLAVLSLLLTTSVSLAGDTAGAKRAFRAHKTMAVIVLEPALISVDSETSSDVMYYLGDFKKKNPSIPVFTLSSKEYMSIFFGPPMVWKDAAIFIQPNGNGLVIPTYVLDAAIYDDAGRWLSGMKPKAPGSNWQFVPVQARKP
jgi:hypothetical protein